MLSAFPDPPELGPKTLEECRATGDYRHAFFEWYKYIGLVANLASCLQIDSRALRPVPPLHYSVMIGLLNRCARLCLANVALSHEGRFGESTAIIDRCIFESSIVLIWLCQGGRDNHFRRFLAAGLKSELELKKRIEEEMAARGGKMLQIEERMLASIGRYISSSGLGEETIRSTPKLPDLASMIGAIGKDRLLYIVGQRMGSHHVHGTWVSLRLHYLEEDGGILVPRDHDCATHTNQLVFTALVIAEAIEEFVRFVCEDSVEAAELCEPIARVRSETLKLYQEAVGSDLEAVEEV